MTFKNSAFLFCILPVMIMIITGCTKDQHPPNIILILADDLGYGELGCYGQTLIETPHVDALAETGMRFTQFYTGAPVCAPARCILMTGKHSGHAHIRGNDEWRERGAVWDFQAMFDDPRLEGQRPIPDSTITMAEQLKKAGYATACVGKWGLGAPGTEGLPNRQGFDLFYGYNCQRQAHTFYPLHLWKNDEKVLLNNPIVPPNTKLDINADPHNPDSYAPFSLTDYTPKLMQDEVVNFIRQHRNDPFFLYYATPIPHVPLQAPKRWVEYYQEKLGSEDPYLGDKGYFPNRTPRATYAAMISYLDEQVGEIVQVLKESKIDNNTLVIFTSDNGPTYAGGADTPFFESARPFNTERGWAKGFVHEGGIRVPLVVNWPGKIEAGSTSPHIAAFQDFFPTFCELAGIEIPEKIDGISILPTLDPQRGTQTEHPYLYWEFPENNGQQAVRMGNWKGIRKNIKDGDLEIKLYDLSKDIKEEHDVASQFPDIVKNIEDIMTEAHIPASLERFKLGPLDLK